MINVPDQFKEQIRAIYPPNNRLIFEEWFYAKYKDDVSEREYLPVFWTSYLVNHSHAKEAHEVPELQSFVDSLDRSKKYFSIVQYDLGVVVDLKDLDILLFNMSQNIGYPLPLLCEPQKFVFNDEKKYLCNFVGNMTHPVRSYALQLQDRQDCYISFQPHDIEDYCRVIHQSIFTLCFRGFGANSFRIQESLQYGSIPVYISDDFIMPHNLDFETFGVVIEAKDADKIYDILSSFSHLEISKKQEQLKHIYDNFFTYKSNFDIILSHLKNENL